jgi:hypothetical protein
MTEEELAKTLFATDSEKYGSSYVEHLLQQYKVFVDGIEKISDRRLKTNEFFLTLNSAVITALGFVAKDASTRPALLLAATAGIFISYFWYRIIKSYRGLNSGKFKVVHAIEKRLPVSLYGTEWEVLGRGKLKNFYHPFTHIETRIPWVFLGIYAVLVIVFIPWGTVHALLFKLARLWT